MPQHGCTGALRLAGGGGKQWSRRRGGQCRQCRESSHSLAGPLRDGLITGDKGQSSCAIAKDSAVCGKARDDRSSVAGSACSRQRGGERRGRRAATHANPSSQTIPAPLLHACGVVRAASERRSTPARAVAPPCAETTASSAREKARWVLSGSRVAAGAARSDVARGAGQYAHASPSWPARKQFGISKLDTTQVRTGTRPTDIGTASMP